jgi:hypothetical protein
MRIAPLLLLALAVSAAPAARGADGAALEQLRISLLDGDVQVKMPESADWLPAAVNTPLRAGDRLWVPAGARLELQLRDGGIVRLNERSALELLRLATGSPQFYLTRGQAFLNFSARRGQALQLDTPFAVLRVHERAVFRVDVGENGDTELGVLHGLVWAESHHERTGVPAGRALILRADRAESVALAPADDWERWNLARDRELETRGASVRYLPPELGIYAYDFDAHGRWVSVAEHGWVWTPLTLSFGWAPYRYGRWVWIGDDYVWISYDPWGWAPHHYGRWVFAAGFGWCWVPPPRGAVFWAPGWVAWVHSHPHIAWLPLAPSEIYHGYGHYGPHSINLLQVGVHKTLIKPAYRNARIEGAVTVIIHDAFLKGRPAVAAIKDNPFLRETIRPGRPEIKPERASFAPIVKDIPRAARPPAALEGIEIQRLQESRPLVKEPARPVSRPATPVQPAPSEERRRIEAPRAPAATVPAERHIETAPRAPQRPPIIVPAPSEPRPQPATPTRREPPADGGSSRRQEPAPAVRGVERAPATPAAAAPAERRAIVTPSAPSETPAEGREGNERRGGFLQPR